MLKLVVVCTLLSAFSYKAQCQPSDVESEKSMVNGLSLVAVNNEIDSTHVLPMKSVGSNWVAIIPFAYMPSSTLPQLVYDEKWQWLGERIEGARSHIREVHGQDVSVMMKPQIWVGHGTFTGTIGMLNEEDWESLEKNYTKFILDYARMAEEEEVEMLSIGTELQSFVESRKPYWRSLIKEVRSVYSGKLTYASNWDEFDKVEFWDLLDYIGVDAYFPISKVGKSKLKDLKKGWEPHVTLMDSIAYKYDKQLLFTEYGYRSIEDCAAKPWDYSDKAKVDQTAQALALEALYEAVWMKDNFAGGFLWKWHPDHSSAGGKSNSMFTVQNKGAALVVKKYYK